MICRETYTPAGYDARYVLGDAVVVYGFREPAGTIKLRSGKCTMPGMNEARFAGFLSRATFDGWEG